MTRTWRIVVGADDAGYEHKEAIKADLEASGLVADGGHILPLDRPRELLELVLPFLAGG